MNFCRQKKKIRKERKKMKKKEKKKKKKKRKLRQKKSTFHGMEGTLPRWLQKWVSQGG